MNARLQIMLDSRQLEALAAGDDEIAGMWSKAVRTLRSSGVPGLDADAAYTLAYQAALQAATALVRAAIYDWQSTTSEDDLAALRQAATRLFGAGYAWQVAERPLAELEEPSSVSR